MPTTSFVPDEELLAYIDAIPGEVVRWHATGESTEFYPMVEVQSVIAPEPQYIVVNFSEPGT